MMGLKDYLSGKAKEAAKDATQRVLGAKVVKSTTQPERALPNGIPVIHEQGVIGGLSEYPNADRKKAGHLVRLHDFLKDETSKLPSGVTYDRRGKELRIVIKGWKESQIDLAIRILNDYRKQGLFILMGYDDKCHFLIVDFPPR